VTLDLLILWRSIPSEIAVIDRTAWALPNRLQTGFRPIAHIGCTGLPSIPNCQSLSAIFFRSLYRLIRIPAPSSNHCPITYGTPRDRLPLETAHKVVLNQTSRFAIPLKSNSASPRDSN
jgi:hypothetical protein